MKLRWKILTIACLLIVLLMTVACDSSSSSSNGKTVITFDTPTSNTPALLKSLNQIIDDYNHSHPNVVVQLHQTPFASYDNTLETQFRGGAGPDVMLVNFVDLGAWKSAGYLQDLEPSLNEAHRSSAGYAQGFYKDGSIDGGQYGLPIVMDVRALYYNKEIFKRYNLKPPTTWDELLSNAQILHTHGIYGMAAVMDNNWSGVWEASGNFLLSNGGKILSSDGKQAEAANDPRNIEAYQYFFDKLRPYFPPGVSNMNNDTVQSLFASGKLAMFESGPWFASGITQDNPKMVFGDTYGIAPLPASTFTGKAISASGGWFISTAKNSQHAKEAWDFVNYFTKPELATKVALAQSDMPTYLDAFKEAPWNTEFYKPFYAQLATGASPVQPLIPQLSAVVSTLWKQLQLISSGSKSVQAGLQDFDKQANVILQSS